MNRVKSWLDRYRAGDTEAVWREIGRHSPLVEPERSHAEIVATETMRRARSNVERLITSLPSIGYVFAAGNDAYRGPSPNAREEVAALEETVGPIPLALRSWYLEVGEVDLSGVHPPWDAEYLDPLVFNAPIPSVLQEYEEWQGEQGTEWARERFHIEFAPDFFHKAGVSGGSAYGIEAPSDAPDPIVLGERHATSFVGYLRIVLARAGVPAVEWGDEWARSAPPELVAVSLQLERL